MARRDSRGLSWGERIFRLRRRLRQRTWPIRKSAIILFERASQWLKRRPEEKTFSVGIISVGLYLLYESQWVAAVAALAAWFALMRHFAQTDADRQRRIMESFSKSIEQLGSEKIEVRLGGIYGLERISKESPDDYWTVMETLAAFVRERTRRNEIERTSQDLQQRVSHRAYLLWVAAGRPDGKADAFWVEAAHHEEFGEPPTVDIEAALTVIMRRSNVDRERERTNGWRLDLSKSVLKRANLRGARLERANLREAHLENANLRDAHLENSDLIRAHLDDVDAFHAHFEDAKLIGAHLEKSNLWDAHFERADLSKAHLEGAQLWGVHFESANLSDAHFEEAYLNRTRLKNADLQGAHLEGADLFDAEGLSDAQLLFTTGDGATKLPARLRQIPKWAVRDAGAERATSGTGSSAASPETRSTVPRRYPPQISAPRPEH